MSGYCVVAFIVGIFAGIITCMIMDLRSCNREISRYEAEIRKTWGKSL